MKTEKFKKLVLTKLTIANLGENELKKVEGGIAKTETSCQCANTQCTCGGFPCYDSIPGHQCQ